MKDAICLPPLRIRMAPFLLSKDLLRAPAELRLPDCPLVPPRPKA